MFFIFFPMQNLFSMQMTIIDCCSFPVFWTLIFSQFDFGLKFSLTKLRLALNAKLSWYLIILIGHFHLLPTFKHLTYSFSLQVRNTKGSAIFLCLFAFADLLFIILPGQYLKRFIMTILLCVLLPGKALTYIKFLCAAHKLPFLYVCKLGFSN